MHRLLCALGISLLVSACSSGIETRVQSAGVTTLESQTYAVTATEYESADLKIAHDLVEGALTSRGFARADTAPLHLQVTVDARCFLSGGKHRRTTEPVACQAPQAAPELCRQGISGGHYLDPCGRWFGNVPQPGFGISLQTTAG